MSIEQSVNRTECQGTHFHSLLPYFLIIPLDGGSSDVAYDDNDAEERYRRCFDGLAKMREEAADDVLLRPEL